MSVDDVAELTSAKQIAAFLILARYYALCRFAQLISTRVDTDGLTQEGDRDSIFAHVMELREYTAREALAYGYVLEVTSDSLIGSANQDVDQDGDKSAWERDVFPTDYISDLPYFEPGFYYY